MLIGEKSITTGTDGLASFRFRSPDTLAVSDEVTATTTDDVTGQTSELRAPLTIASS